MVILSITIVILGAFTALVITSNIASIAPSEWRMRLSMACIALGGSIWVMHFVGLLALRAPINWAHNPGLLAASAFTALSGTGLALYLWTFSRENDALRLPSVVAVFGLTIAATHYIGLSAVAAPNLHLSWFLAVICIAFSIQVAGMAVWFLFRPRGVIITLFGAAGLGLAFASTHYLAVSSTLGLEQTLAAIPQLENPISDRHLAWSATIMMYLICSICLCVFAVTQFRDDVP
jgi:NO-binding membrane sensor protein with MHYT domain